MSRVLKIRFFLLGMFFIRKIISQKPKIIKLPDHIHVVGSDKIIS